MGRRRGYLCLLRDLQSWRKDDPFKSSQLGRSFNPSLIKSFFLGLSTVSPAHRRDFCSESILGLGYVDVVAVLLSLISFSLGFSLVLLSMQPCLFSLFFKFFGLLQLLLQSYRLLLGRSQLFLGLLCQLPLALGLRLSTLQGSLCTLPGLFLSLQLLLEISIAVFSNG